MQNITRLPFQCQVQWRSQGGGHWAIAQYLKIYCPKIFGDDGYCPALKTLTDMWFPKTQSGLAKTQSSLAKIQSSSAKNFMV